MASGCFFATSSMSIPPIGLPTITGPMHVRSIRNARYVSRAMSSASATITYRQTDRDRQTDRQRWRGTDGDRQTDRQTDNGR